MLYYYQSDQCKLKRKIYYLQYQIKTEAQVTRYKCLNVCAYCSLWIEIFSALEIISFINVYFKKQLQLAK